jgi:hypothetical protein
LYDMAGSTGAMRSGDRDNRRSTDGAVTLAISRIDSMDAQTGIYGE